MSKADTVTDPTDELGNETAEQSAATLGGARDRVVRATQVVREEAAKAGDYAKERYGVAADSLREGYGRARKDLDRLSEDVTTYVKDNPGRSILIAGAVGFLVGFLIRGERRR